MLRTVIDYTEFAMRFGKRLKEHVDQQKVPADWYVNYKRLKAAIKRGCSEKQFQELYNEELQKFVVNLDRGMADDPKFVEWNRLALDNICKKFDKRMDDSTLAVARAAHRRLRRGLRAARRAAEASAGDVVHRTPRAAARET